MGYIRFALYGKMVTYVFLIFYMLLAHIVDYNVCKIILIPFLIRKIYLIQPPFVILIRHKYTHTIYGLNNPP